MNQFQNPLKESAKRKIERELEQENNNSAQKVYHEQLEAILANAVDAIITIDETGLMTSVNPAAEGMFGFSTQEMIGSKINILMPKPFCDRHDQFVAEYLTTGIRKIIGIGREVTGQRKDGTVFPMHLAVSEIHVDDQRLFTGIIRDISDVKAVEKKLVQHERLAAIGQMMAGLAHESRNAFQRSHACLANLAFDVREMAESLQLVHKVQNALDHLNSLLDEVRDYAAPIVLKKSRNDLTGLIQEIWEQIQSAYHDTDQIQFYLTCSADFPDVVTFDRLRIGQVIWNLLENARAACDPVDGKIEVSLRINRSNELPVTVMVTDNGKGVPREVASQIFEPFFTTKTKGTGLGLAICKRIVDAHCGQLVLGRPSEGATFVLSLSEF